MKPNFGTIGPGRRWRDKTHLKHPILTDEAFTPLAAGELPTLFGDFDDIEAAEQDAVEAFRRRYRRALMLDEEFDD